MQINAAVRLQWCFFCYIFVSFTIMQSVWETRQFAAMQVICYPFKYLFWYITYHCLGFVIRHWATWLLIAMILWHLSVWKNNVISGKIWKIIWAASIEKSLLVMHMLTAIKVENHGSFDHFAFSFVGFQRAAAASVGKYISFTYRPHFFQYGFLLCFRIEKQTIVLPNKCSLFRVSSVLFFYIFFPLLLYVVIILIITLTIPLTDSWH